MFFVNYYVCPQCKGSWQDIWSATCDDDCPHCGARHISPIASDDAPDREESAEDAVDMAAARGNRGSS